MERKYIKISPSRGLLRPDTVVQYLGSLREIQTSGHRLNPFGGKDGPVIEFLVYSGGDEDPVEFYMGIDPEEHIYALEDKLSALYPDSFQTEIVEFSLMKALHEQLEHRVALESANPDREQEELPVVKEDSLSDNEYRGSENPHVIRWDGKGNRRNDWMTPLKRFSQREQIEDPDQTHRSPLAALLEVMSDSPYPAGFQVLFTPREDWSKSAERRKTRLRMKADTVTQGLKMTFEDAIFGSGGDRESEEIRNRHRARHPSDVGSSAQEAESATGDIAHRSELIDKKRPAHTFTANVRAVVLPVGKHADELQPPKAIVNRLQSSLNHLDGEYYGLKPTRLDRGLAEKLSDSSKFLSTKSRKELRKMEARKIDSNSRVRKTKANLVLNPDELANFVTVPSSKSLTKQARRGTRGKPELQDPLPTPDPDTLEKYSGPGMAVGYPVGEDREPLTEPVELTAKHLVRHAIRLSSTGGGKSVAVINDALTAHENIPGPVVIIDPKGDGLAEEYQRAHFKIYRSLEDVYYFPVPETLPAFSFFDIRPELARGEDRAKAIENKTTRFKEILRMVMGRENFDDARASIKVIEHLIAALFDEQYGSDAFGIQELEEAAWEMLSDKRIPEVSDANRDIERKLARHFEGDSTSFTRILNGAINRLDEITSNTYLNQIFNHVPEWDPETQSYTEPTFDFHEFHQEDVVILFDTGKLRPEAQQALTLLFLSNFWEAAQIRRDSSGSLPEHITNLVLEEAAPIASTELVANELIPQGRSFGVSLELVMQYGEQVALETQGKSGHRGYREVLNNVHTKLIGNIDLDEDLAKVLENERLSASEWAQRLRSLPSGAWVADLVNPGFQQRSPEPFNLAPLPIPAGHSESEDPLHPDMESNFKQKVLPRIRKRTAADLGIKDISEENDTEPEEGGFHGDVSAGAGSPSPEQNTTSGEVDVSETGNPPGSNRDVGRSDRPDESSDGLSAMVESVDEEMMDASDAEPSTAEVPDGGAESESATPEIEDPLQQADIYEAGLPDHIEADHEQNEYHCTLCGSTYLSGQRSSADNCCVFDSEEELLDAAPRLYEAADTDSPYEFAGALMTHAENVGVSVDFSALTDILEQEDDTPQEDADSSDDADASIPVETFKEAVAEVSDDALREHNLTREEAKFLGTVIDAMNDRVEGYSLTESMTDLRDGFEDIDVEKLVENGFLEEHRVAFKRYYTAKPAARNLLSKPLRAKPFEGDLGEKTPHKVGVEMLRRWFESFDEVDHAEKYYPLGDDEVVDVAGFDADGSLEYVGEVELSSNNYESIVKDYKQLAGADATAVWAFKNQEDAVEIVEVLNDRVDLGLLLTATMKRDKSQLADRLREKGDPGIEEIIHFSDLNDEVDS